MGTTPDIPHLINAQQHDTLRHHDFFVSNGSSLFPCLSLQPDLLGRDFQDVRDSLTDCIPVRAELRLLCKNDAVEITNSISPRANFAGRVTQYFRRVQIAISLISIRVPLPNIPQSYSSQQGVGNGVQKYIGVAMTNQMPFVRQINSTQSEWSAGRQPVGIVANTNANRDVILL